MENISTTKYVNAGKMLEKYEHSIYDTTDLAEMLYYMPAADVEEVKRGRWIPQEYMSEIDSFIYTEYKCSNCVEISKKKSNYCPNCGTKMEGEQNG